MKRRVVVLTTLIVTLLLCVCGLFACDKQNGNTGNVGQQEQQIDWNLVYTCNGSEITGLTEYGKTLTKLVIPEKINGQKITSLGKSAFRDCASLTSVEIGSGVTSIGEDVFHSCNSLTSVTIPNSVTSIGGGAFEYCRSLTSIEIPISINIMLTYHSPQRLASSLPTHI